MASLTENPYDGIAQLWTKLDTISTCMLGVTGSGQHPQPMTIFPETKTGIIWIISSKDTDLVQAIGQGAEAVCTVQSGSGDYHASLIGAIEQTTNAKKLDALWSYGVAAWFEHGRDDPDICLLKYIPREAAVWETEGNPAKVGLKLMRAAMQEGEDSPGVSKHHIFHLNDT